MNFQTLPEIEILEDSETALEPLYKVLIHNDNVTPMDFVVHILKTVFYLGVDRASEIMMTAHINGNAYVQTLAKSEAEKRIDKAHFESNNAGYPLNFTMERE
ncbi:MAG: ATP-dependent Clp protease adaptor ClpS [Anaerolineae bacterium]|nr:ATP-dependent Clp protease adaptor ClpS [Anaerolineae bacterium]MBL8104123.1 ATP-dependent Clp protease adaptor ClpS [Anaerolineales bacterium]MCC7190979.1 ATP-dependent Clp protease adaptor ClpS [Anaerolineales bacterium]